MPTRITSNTDTFSTVSDFVLGQYLSTTLDATESKPYEIHDKNS